MLVSGTLKVTLPSRPNSELASISLVPFPGVAGRSSMPKRASAVMLILPPSPCSALATISLPSPLLGKPIINSALISILPPIAFPLASAEIKLSCSKVRNS